MRSGNKAELLYCLIQSENSESSSRPSVEVLVLDGAAILHATTRRSNDIHGNNVFLPYIQSQFQHVSRLDIVLDVYRPDSLKADARGK